MTDIRFVHANDGRVLTIEIDGAVYTPEQIKAALAEYERLRAALIRWRDADGTMGFPDADAELAELARGLKDE